MPALTPSFLYDFETRIRLIAEDHYKRLNSNTWWNVIAKTMPSQSKKERITWLLDTAKIERPNGRGQAIFEDIVSKTTEFENEPATGGLKLTKEQLEDLDGNGVKLAAHWARQMGAYAAYWPQKVVAKAIRDNIATYDGLAFFAKDHLVNPFDSGVGTFHNRFTGSASGAYPGAIKIDSSVTVDVAVENVAKAIAYIASIKMPNGEDPRHLRVTHLLVPPALASRAQQITNAKYIAQAASSGGGSGDVEAVIRNFGLGQPVVCPELGAAFGGSDTSWYLACSEITSDELGAFVYVDRESFTINFHGPMTDAELARSRELEWTTHGRNTVGAGHPYLFFRADAA
jgi:phage major head subunit gpT-like protein